MQTCHQTVQSVKPKFNVAAPLLFGRDVSYAPALNLFALTFIPGMRILDTRHSQRALTIITAD